MKEIPRIAYIGDVGIVGVKGFAGGFGRWALAAWGERVIKQFGRKRFRNTRRFE